MNRYSSSKLKAFDTCRLRYKKHYLDKIRIEQPITADTQFGSLIHEVAEKFRGDNYKELVKLSRKYELNEEFRSVLAQTYKNVFSFIRKYEKNEAQLEQEIEWIDEDENIWLYGLVDRLLKSPLISVDYKTSKNPNRDRHIFQMRLYALIISKIYEIEPKDIKCIIYYPRVDVEDKFLFSNQEIQLFEDNIKNMIATIESNTDWSPSTGYHCRWCEYNKTHHCPATYEGE